MGRRRRNASLSEEIDNAPVPVQEVTQPLQIKEVAVKGLPSMEGLDEVSTPSKSDDAENMETDQVTRVSVEPILERYSHLGSSHEDSDSGLDPELDDEDYQEDEDDEDLDLDGEDDNEDEEEDSEPELSPQTQTNLAIIEEIRDLLHQLVVSETTSTMANLTSLTGKLTQQTVKGCLMSDENGCDHGNGTTEMTMHVKRLEAILDLAHTGGNILNGLEKNLKIDPSTNEDSSIQRHSSRSATSLNGILSIFDSPGSGFGRLSDLLG